MAPRSAGITFSETMAGAFALGASDPRAGAERGRAQGTRLALHATVTVRDIDRFVADPEHRGEIAGRVDFTPFGTGLPTEVGTFNLFAPSGDPALRLMIYELPFRVEGTDYYLAGRKEVRDDPGLDAWADLTTLYTTLHRGRDAAGEIIGAGVLTLSMGEFMKVLGTLRVVDTDSIAEKTRILGTFGRFFAGSVWDAYAPADAP